MPALPLPTLLRPLAAGTFVSALGNGAWYASWALFLVRVLELPAAQAGIALSVAGVAGIVAATPLGTLADRIGPREVLIALSVVRALTMGGFLLADGLVGLTVVASLMSASQQGATAVKTAMVAGLTPPDERLDALSSLRVLGHAGDALGAAGGALVIQLDTRGAYVALIAANALTYLAYAVAAARLPRVAAVPEAEHRLRRGALRDGPYVALAAICGVLTLCWAMVSTALPLWVAGHTEAPRATSGILVVVSSVAIAALQVRCTRAAGTPATAARVAVISGAALAASCVLFAAASGPAAHTAALLLLAGGIAHIAGELLFVAASWGLSVPLMPDGRAGEYQGVFATGQALALTVAPMLMTAVVVGWGQAGWLALGALFVLATLPAPAITRRALRARAPGAGAAPAPAPARSG
jgi:MFS family permease